MKKYRVETREFNGAGYNYEDLACDYFEAVDGEDAIAQYKDYLKDQVTSYSGLPLDEVEEELARIDQMDCRAELVEDEKVDITNVDLDRLGDKARRIFEESDQEARRAIFGACRTIEDIDAVAESWYSDLFGKEA